ncbi:acetylhydrolase, partial [bacterium]|nr:acetylhydrolase [bacterium]
MIINGLRIAAIISAALVSSFSLSAEQLYTDQPPVTPELAFPGTYNVGVTTITANDPKRLNTSNFITSIERPLVLEVWYPAQAPEKATRATYKNVTRLQKPF